MGPKPTTRSRAPRVAAAAALAVLALLALAQWTLPPLAEDAVRDRLGGAAEVTAVDVRALPAVELLWRRADRMTVRMRSYDATGVDVAGELARTRGVARLDIEIDRLRAPRGVVLRRLRLRKRDASIGGSALADGRQLAAALPPGVELRLEPQEGGRIVLAGRIGGLRVRVRVIARGGRVVVRPDGLLGAFAGLTVFADERIAVDDVAAVALGGDRYVLSARGRLP